jgi:hypothetical protein
VPVRKYRSADDMPAVRPLPPVGSQLLAIIEQARQPARRKP